MFTNKRLFMMDIQGMTGKKQEFPPYLYSMVTKCGVKTVGRLDLDVDWKIWTRSEQEPIEKSWP